jgi:DNA polymerase III subunit epsilon
MRLPSLRRAQRGFGATPAAYADAAVPRGRTPWREAAWCALDFELTGLDPQLDDIISFGAIPIDRGRVQLGPAIAGLVRPERHLSVASIRVHGIRAADLAGAPALADAIGPLLDAIAGRGLVVHTASVERAFLGRALTTQGLKLRNPIVDTEMLGRLWLHERDGALKRRLGLSEIAGELGLPAERPHDALGDALTTAQVFIALATHLDALHPETVASLGRAGQRLESIRAFFGS